MSSNMQANFPNQKKKWQTNLSKSHFHLSLSEIDTHSKYTTDTSYWKCGKFGGPYDNLRNGF